MISSTLFIIFNLSVLVTSQLYYDFIRSNDAFRSNDNHYKPSHQDLSKKIQELPQPSTNCTCTLKNCVVYYIISPACSEFKSNCCSNEFGKVLHSTGNALPWDQHSDISKQIPNFSFTKDANLKTSGRNLFIGGTQQMGAFSPSNPINDLNIKETINSKSLTPDLDTINRNQPIGNQDFFRYNNGPPLGLIANPKEFTGIPNPKSSVAKLFVGNNLKNKDNQKVIDESLRLNVGIPRTDSGKYIVGNDKGATINRGAYFDNRVLYGVKVPMLQDEIAASADCTQSQPKPKRSRRPQNGQDYILLKPTYSNGNRKYGFPTGY